MSYIKVCRWQVHFWFTTSIVSALERSRFLESRLPHHLETSFRSSGRLTLFSARTPRRRVVDCACLIGTSSTTHLSEYERMLGSVDSSSLFRSWEVRRAGLPLGYDLVSWARGEFHEMGWQEQQTATRITLVIQRRENGIRTLNFCS
jgi:hypothetical protein